MTTYKARTRTYYLLQEKYVLPLLIVVQTFTFYDMPLAVRWTTAFLIIIFTIRYAVFEHVPIRRLYVPVGIWIVWATAGFIRGLYVAGNYWEYKNLFAGLLIVYLPLLCYYFSSPVTVFRTLRCWIKYGFPVFMLFYVWNIDRGYYHFYIAPMFLFACLIPILPWKWKCISGGLMLLMLFIDIGARSQIIKAFVAIAISSAIAIHRLLSDKLVRSIHIICYAIPVVLLGLGISGRFNIFENLSSHEGKYYAQNEKAGGRIKIEDIASDTRTFIYNEVITSAVRHHYILFGRTLARGNDSAVFGAHMAEELKTGKYERYRNEVCHPNIFTWLGLVGVVLYSIIYIQASFLAVYRSHSIYLRLIGLFIAFQWSYGWVENTSDFNIMNIFIWLLIGMGLSRGFRNMTNRDFVNWVYCVIYKL